MKRLYAIILLCLFLNGCVIAVPTSNDNISYYKTCIEGVQYYAIVRSGSDYSFGSTVAYNTDGSIKTCGK